MKEIHIQIHLFSLAAWGRQDLLQGLSLLTSDDIDDHVFSPNVKRRRRRRSVVVIVVHDVEFRRQRQQHLDLRHERPRRSVVRRRADGGGGGSRLRMISSQQLLRRRYFPEILEQVVKRILLGASADGVFVLEQELVRVDDFPDGDEDGGFGERGGVGELVHVEVDFGLFDLAGAREETLHLFVRFHDVGIQAGEMRRIAAETLVARDELRGEEEEEEEVREMDL